MIKMLFFIFALLYSFTLFAERAKFLIWNIEKESQKTFYSDLSRFYENDFLLFQEASMTERFIQEMGSAVFAEAIVWKGIPSGVLTKSNFELISSEQILTKNTEPILHTNKATLITRYRLPHHENPLIIVNTHGINFVSDEIYRDEIEAIFEKVKKEKGILIWAGDFNSWNLDRMKILKDTMARLHLAEALFTPDKRKKFLFSHLDHFFYDATAIEILGTFVDGDCQGSDHAPLFIELNFK